MRLAAYAGDPNRVALLRRQVAAMPALGGPVESLADDLRREMRSLPPGVHTVIFSSEHCHSRLVTVASIERLRSLLTEHFSSFRVVVYLRRQDELALSFLSTRLRNGQDPLALLPPPNQNSAYFDYGGLVDRWATVFGREAMTVRLYGREHFLNGDLVQDFVATCGLAPIAFPEGVGRRNPGLRASAQAFIWRLNAMRVVDGESTLPHWLVKLLDDRYAGPGLMPSRAEAEAFVGRFAAGNERVRAAYFPQRAALFPEDFSRYGETPTQPSDAEVLDVALEVIRHALTLPDQGDAAPRRARDAAFDDHGAATPPAAAQAAGGG
jgi:hypothetical protein